MTKEELAEEYANEVFGLYYPTDQERYQVEQAFLAGLKAGRPKWHKISDGDYPPMQKGIDYSVDVLTNEGEIAYFSYEFDTWYGYLPSEASTLVIEPPVAWCELPKYTEE